MESNKNNNRNVDNSIDKNVTNITDGDINFDTDKSENKKGDNFSVNLTAGERGNKPKKIKEKLWSSEFFSLGSGSCLFYITQYILITTLPIVVIDSLHGSEFQAGLAMVFFQIGTLILRPFAGTIVDSFDKNKVIMMATGIFMLIMISFNFVNSLNLIFFLRTLHGMSFALVTTAAAAMAVLILPKSRKGEGVGYFAVFSNLAMVLGPSVGLIVLAQYGTSSLFISLSVIAITAFVILTLNKIPKELSQPTPKNGKKRNLEDFYEKKALPWALMGLFVSICYSGVLVFVPIMMKSVGVATEASLFFVLYAMAIVITRPFIGRVFDNMGADYVLYPGFAFFISGLALLSQANSLTLILISAPIIGIGFGALSPGFQTLAVESVSPSKAGTATANYFLSMDLGVGIGSFGLALVVERIGYSNMYVFNTLVAVVGLLLYILVVRKWSKNLEN